MHLFHSQRCTILLATDEDEVDNIFIRWVPRTRHLSSMMALRASTVDACFERKLHYGYAKQNAKGKLRTTPKLYAKQHTSASATTVDTGLHRGTDVSSSNPTITLGKRQRLQDDPDHGVQKRSWRTSSPTGGVSQVPMSSTTQDNHASSSYYSKRLINEK